MIGDNYRGFDVLGFEILRYIDEEAKKVYFIDPIIDLQQEHRNPMVISVVSNVKNQYEKHHEPKQDHQL